MVLYALAPSARTPQGFFAGRDRQGRAAGGGMLTCSVFIAWIFAKSVTNAANLGAQYGIVGGLAYAIYWLSIPVAAMAIFAIRRSTGARGLAEFLGRKFGRAASLSYGALVFTRLFNEVWSNTAVVGGYYGEPGSLAFVAAALLFTFAVLMYSLKGGLRSSIFTDVLHGAVFVVFLATVLFMVVPLHPAGALLREGTFALSSGGDLLCVATLQVLSYPFQDPVLTDRAFITEERAMLKAFLIAGVAGFVAILLFSLVGVHARMEHLLADGNAPAAVARSLGFGATFVMTVVMVNAAGSTLDSAFASVSKATAVDLPRMFGEELAGSVRVGSAAMIAMAVLGNIPIFFGADILAATTVSGTMVMGLAPVFLLQRLAHRSPWSFHLAFWTGMALGILYAARAIPASWAIGDGKYALLLGTNAYGLLLCTGGFLLPLVQRKAIALVLAYDLPRR